MNTPTPAQALGECLKLSDRERELRKIGGGDWAGADRLFTSSAKELIREHGQHFAGLEAEAERLRDAVEAAHMHGGGWLRRAEAAEARVREAEGLLRDVLKRDQSHYFNGECRCSSHSRAAEREYENGTCPHQRIAAFFAAKG